MKKSDIKENIRERRNFVTLILWPIGLNVTYYFMTEFYQILYIF